MKKNISSTVGRLSLMTIVFAGLLLSIGSLFWIGRDGGIRPELQREALFALVAFYVPFIALIAAFYFGEERKEDATTSIETFICAAALATLWMITPICLILFSNWAVQDILRFLEKVRVLGDSSVLAAIGYYFSKKQPRKRRRSTQTQQLGSYGSISNPPG